MARPSKTIRARLQSLEQHLQEENPLLVSAVDGFRRLSKVGYAMGLLSTDESYATQIPWWPLISVLGTFSAGKSTFINQHLGYPLQDTGNQAIDDKFTVVCYSGEKNARVLPGLALDADPRFPFYQTSDELEKVAEGEGKRIDAYLQLKTCGSKNLRGRIVIDSPGFDADSQRSATLRLTKHIIDLSDLVLVFFDARHPEPKSMSDTLTHLVKDTINRPDSTKFLYILNQIDTAAREDNAEEVISAWQRALAREGLTAGRYYCIYDPDAAVPIENPTLRRRYEWKRDQDMSDIADRIDQVSIDRSYRIIGALEKRAHEIENIYVPRIRNLITQWRKKVLRTEGVILALCTSVIGGLHIYNPGLFTPLAKLADKFTATPLGITVTSAVAATILLGLHFWIRRLVSDRIIVQIEKEYTDDEAERMTRVFHKNSQFWSSIFEVDPAGWNWLNRKRLHSVKADAGQYVQQLNDRFTDPSGKKTVDDKEPHQPDDKEPPVITGEIISSFGSS